MDKNDYGKSSSITPKRKVLSQNMENCVPNRAKNKEVNTRQMTAQIHIPKTEEKAKHLGENLSKLKDSDNVKVASPKTKKCKASKLTNLQNKGNICGNHSPDSQKKLGKENLNPQFSTPDFKINIDSKSNKEDNFTNKQSGNTNDLISPDLRNLILNPKTHKIRRPPNAFMLFAKDQRRQIKLNNPKESNRIISTIIGDMWRNLDEEGQLKYYREAEALEKLHKQLYPGYVYNPYAARLSKEKKSAKKNKPSITASISINKNIKTETNPDLNNKDQCSKKAESSDHSVKTEGFKMNSDCIRSSYQSASNPQFPPFWNSELHKGWPPYDGMMHLREFYRPACTHQAYNCGKSCSPSKSHCPVDCRENTMSSKLAHNPNPFPNMFPSNFHPAMWNPWFMLPNPYHLPPISRPLPPPEYLKNWACPTNFAPPIQTSYGQNPSAQFHPGHTSLPKDKSPSEEIGKPKHDTENLRNNPSMSHNTENDFGQHQHVGIVSENDSRYLKELDLHEESDDDASDTLIIVDDDNIQEVHPEEPQDEDLKKKDEMYINVS